MMHGNSTDPVFVKKISLRVWTLRDELEAVIAERYKDSENKPSIDDLLEEYKVHGTIEGGDAAPLGADGDAVKDASELDDFGEDEMAKAIAAAEAGEDPNAGEEGANSQDDIDAMMAAAQEGGDEGENSSQADIDAMMEGGGEASSQDDIDALMASGGELPEEKKPLTIATASEEKNGKVIIKQRAPLLPEDKIFTGRAILSEVYMDEMYFFSNREYLVGQSIVVDFQVPRRFSINAEVMFCRAYNMKSRIISKNRHPYRVGIKFTYLKEGERTVLRNFVQSIEPTVEAPPPPPAKKADDEDDDDGLGFLDDLDD